MPCVWRYRKKGCCSCYYISNWVLLACDMWSSKAKHVTNEAAFRPGNPPSSQLERPTNEIVLLINTRVTTQSWSYRTVHVYDILKAKLWGDCRPKRIGGLRNGGLTGLSPRNSRNHSGMEWHLLLTSRSPLDPTFPPSITNSKTKHEAQHATKRWSLIWSASVTSLLACGL